PPPCAHRAARVHYEHDERRRERLAYLLAQILPRDRKAPVTPFRSPKDRGLYRRQDVRVADRTCRPSRPGVPAAARIAVGFHAAARSRTLTLVWPPDIRSADLCRVTDIGAAFVRGVAIRWR